MMLTTNISQTTNSSTPKMQEVAIEIAHLKKAFGAQEVIKDLNLTLYANENLVVLGKSGTGKSVLIKCIVNLLLADSGSIKVLGKEVSEMNSAELSEMRQKIGFLFQSGALYDSMTVRQNLEFPLRRKKEKLTEAEINSKVKEVLENVGLADAIEKMPSQLSGGMRKRISLARTIVTAPLIMLYDEPTTGLDPVTSDEISKLILDLQKKYKTASIIITHDIKCALTTANRIIMLSDGSVYKVGTKEEFKNSDDALISSFFN